MACGDSVARATKASVRDQAALGADTTEGRTKDEYCCDREFFVVTDFLQFFIATEILCRDRLLKVFYRNRESRNMGFSHVGT